MQTVKFAGIVSVAGLLFLQIGSARADIASDRAAAILVFPKIVTQSFVVGPFTDPAPPTELDVSVDTLVQISNTSNAPVQLHCFYINANSHCSISGLVCDPNRVNPCPEAADVCLPGWIETDFEVFLTAQQPLAWRASQGMAGKKVPLDGLSISGPGGQSNVGTAVPPVPAEDAWIGTDQPGTAFTGELKCVVVDSQGQAVPRNVVKGEATIETVAAFTGISDDVDTAPSTGGPGLNVHVQAGSATQNDATGAVGLFQFQLPSVEKYNAVGIQAIDGDANHDNVLELGGDANEYNGCANVLIVDHFFDFAGNPVTGTHVVSDLTLVPCSQDLLNQNPGQTTAQYLVFNEFEQRFSTSAPVNCFFEKPLSLIDTHDPTRSIFSVYVSGTLTGQTRIRGVSAGLIGLLRERWLAETYNAPPDIEVFKYARSDATNVHMQGTRPTADRIVLP